MSEPIYDVGADHQILALGRNRMVLFESGDRPHVDDAVTSIPGEVMVTAERASEKAMWKISSEIEGGPTQSEPIMSENRPDAINAMVQLAYTILGPNPNPTPGAGDGYSTKIPRGLLEAP